MPHGSRLEGDEGDFMCISLRASQAKQPQVQHFERELLESSGHPGGQQSCGEVHNGEKEEMKPEAGPCRPFLQSSAYLSNTGSHHQCEQRIYMISVMFTRTALFTTVERIDLEARRRSKETN